MLVILSLLACLHPTELKVLDNGHYLLTDDFNRLYDCYSAPVGMDWRPTCVRFDYSHEVPWWVRRHYKTIGIHNPGAENRAADDTKEAAEQGEAEDSP